MLLHDTEGISGDDDLLEVCEVPGTDEVVLVFCNVIREVEDLQVVEVADYEALGVNASQEVFGDIEVCQVGYLPKGLPEVGRIII